MKKLLFEKASLNEIVSTINAGLSDITNYRNVFIVSKEKPGFFIQMAELDTSDALRYLLSIKGVLPPDIDKKQLKIETSVFEFIVSTLTEDVDGTPLYACMSLLDLVTASTNTLAAEDGIHLLEHDRGWNMEDKIWDCFEFFNDRKDG